ncbi:hypothetical protein KI387_006961, partial [Taxus chinensis]
YGEMITSSRRSTVIPCNIAHNKPPIGSKRVGINTSSMFEKGTDVSFVSGRIVKKFSSVSTTQNRDEVVSKKIITEDGSEISSLPRSTDMPTFPKAGIKGLGIVDFLKDKNLFITGATGFLAKVLTEKILRMQPQVGKLFLIIKAENYESAQERLKTEVIYSDLFKCVQETHGKKYEEFMMQKLVPVMGDITRENLGMKPELVEKISKEVDIVLNSAANTTFDERYDVALEINTKGTCRILEFAKGCKKLQLYLHISTAYVNGKRKGRVLEKPFHMGDTIARENTIAEVGQATPLLDIEAEFALANKTLKANSVLINTNVHMNDLGMGKQMVQTMKDLGMERAHTLGWQDTYVFTKAMGEMLVNNSRGDLPVVIVRPSIIESTYSDPFPGWMEGNRMLDPIILYYGKGQLCGFLSDPNGVVDVVPADMVVNATLAAMAKHAGKPGLEVYQVGSSVANPLLFGDLANSVTRHFKEKPYVDNKGNPVKVNRVQLFSEIDDFVTHMWSHVSNMLPDIGSNGSSRSKLMLDKHKRICTKFIEQATYLANIYKPYAFYQG